MSKKNETSVQIIENADLDDVHPGDHITWEYLQKWRGVTDLQRRDGIADHRESGGDWQTAEGAWLTYGGGYGTTLTIRRPITKEN